MKSKRQSASQLKKSPYTIKRPPFECIALVLQGGGALGSYQAGVYEALAEVDLFPDWVAGISIGAINAAIMGVITGTRQMRPRPSFYVINLTISD